MTAIMQTTIGTNSNDMGMNINLSSVSCGHGPAHLIRIRDHQTETLPTAALRTEQT